MRNIIKNKRAIITISILLLLLTSLSVFNPFTYATQSIKILSGQTFDYNSIPEYTNQAYVEINNNIPYFEDSELTTSSFEHYSNLDDLGRCQIAYASLGPETLPTEKRKSISNVKPTGWQTVKYPDLIPDKYLYNRCHLIAHELSAENANEKNLITGTRYMNISGMLPFEDTTTQYIKDTNNHVMYRVTPIFIDNELVCRGVLMEAKSVEDNGEGIQFCVFCYNVQPNITIDYATGESHPSDEDIIIIENIDDSNQSESDTIVDIDMDTTDNDPLTNTYIINKRSNIFHLTDCSAVKKMSDKNKETYIGNRADLIDQGIYPCAICNP